MTLLEFCGKASVFIKDETSVTMGLDSLIAVVDGVTGLEIGF